MKRMAVLVLTVGFSLLASFAFAQGKGDNRDDSRSGKVDRKCDGNSGQGDDRKADSDKHHCDHDGDKERHEPKDREARNREAKEKKDRDPHAEHKECMEWFRKKMEELRRKHKEGELCECKLKQMLARLREEMHRRCKAHHDEERKEPPKKHASKKDSCEKEKKQGITPIPPPGMKKGGCHHDEPAAKQTKERPVGGCRCECKEKLERILERRDDYSPERLKEVIEKLKEKCRKEHQTGSDKGGREHDDNGHGNDPGHHDPSNPGKGKGNHGAGR